MFFCVRNCFFVFFRVTQLRGARRGVQGVGRTRWSGQFTCVNKTAPEKLRREVCTICNFESVFLSDLKLV